MMFPTFNIELDHVSQGVELHVSMSEISESGRLKER